MGPPVNPADDTLPPESPQAPRRRRTRAALLAAGLDLLSERPIDALAIDEITARAGVAKGSFFNHFADKAAFERAVSSEIRAQVEQTVTLANRGVEDPARRVARAVCGFVQFALAEGRAAGVMSRAHAAAGGPGHPLNAGARADLARGAAEGRFKLGDLDAAVAFLVGVAQSLIVTVATSRPDPDKARRLASEVLAMTLLGLGVERLEASRLAVAAAAEVIEGPNGP
jgi:AcrR family transcriptional regulator